MDLEGIMLSEVSQWKTNTKWFHLYMEYEKQNKWTNITKQKQTQRHREQTGGFQRGGVGGDEWNRWERLRGTNFQSQNK